MVVAGRPVLVEVRSRRRVGDRDRIPERRAAVCRSAHVHLWHVQVRQERDRRDQPDAMLDVIGDTGVAHALEGG